MKITDMSIVTCILQNITLTCHFIQYIIMLNLLIINKTDLAPYVDVNLESMKDDVKKARNGLPYVFCQMKKQIGVEQVAKFLFSSGGL